MAYTFAQLEQLWTNAGGSAALAPQMAAIAIAESGGNPTGVCYDYTAADGTTKCSSVPVAGGTQADVGLWAIANIHLPPGTDPSVLADPATNAKYAVQLAGQTGNGITSAWAAEFVPGSKAAQRYATALASSGASIASTVQSVASGYGSNASTTSSSSTPPAAAATPGFFGPVIDAAQNIATEVFLGAVALALLSGGILWLASTDSSIRSAATTAAKAAA